MVQKRIVQKLLKYAESIQREGIPVDAMILFGSQASGKGGRDSDIDSLRCLEEVRRRFD